MDRSMLNFENRKKVRKKNYIQILKDHRCITQFRTRFLEKLNQNEEKIK